MTAVRAPGNRCIVGLGLHVHYADAGRAACGSDRQTARCWVRESIATVTCSKCIALFGPDEPGYVDPPAPSYRDEHAARRAAERAERRARRDPLATS